MRKVFRSIIQVPWRRDLLTHSFKRHFKLCVSGKRSKESTETSGAAYQKELPLTQVFNDIQKVLDTEFISLREASRYHFDGLGKAIRPTVVMRLARAVNYDCGLDPGFLSEDQRVVAAVVEMIHTASLVHDDVIDDSVLRRGNPTVSSKWGQSQAVSTGDYIMAQASVTLSRLRHNRAMRIMAEILEDLVQGEFMQLGNKEDPDERFTEYINKSYKKTASLIANGCKAVTVLSGAREEKIQAAYNFGKNIGIAFQLIDDVLDFVSSQEQMGKPTAADIKLGLATAPVLFASHQFPRLNELIMRRFSQEGDLEEALDLVYESSGIQETKALASRYSQESIKFISQFNECDDRQRLVSLANKLVDRLN